MTRSVIIRREAKRDLLEASTWYRNISRHLADDFIRRIDEAIAWRRSDRWRSNAYTEPFAEFWFTASHMRSSTTRTRRGSSSSPCFIRLAIQKHLNLARHSA